MSAVSKVMACRRMFRGTAMMVAVVAPVALLSACAEPPPPAPAPVVVVPPAPAPAPVPPARG